MDCETGDRDPTHLGGPFWDLHIGLPTVKTAAVAKARTSGPGNPCPLTEKTQTIERSGTAARKLGGVVTALVDEDSVGLIYLDSSGSIIEANERGREVLKADGGLRECRRRLVAHRPEDVAAVERLIGMALEGMVDVPEPTPATLGSWPHQRPLILDARPVSQTSYNKARAAVLVVVVDP